MARTREEFIAAITKAGVAPRQTRPPSTRSPIDLDAMAAAARQGATKLEPMQPLEGKDGGFLGPIGKAVDWIDTPRAAIVSGVKELTDLFQGEGFSASDWWAQTSDNMMFGEVLEDWGAKTGIGWLDAGIGFVGDVVFDPLMYLAPAALALRSARSGEIGLSLVSKAEDLRKAAKVASGAKAAELTARAEKLTKAAVKVEQAKGAATAAGPEALAEIGLDLGWRSTVFGTGRVGRSLIEKPLSALSGGKLTRALDVRRARQVPTWIGSIKVGASADEISAAMRLLRAGDTASFKGLSAGVRAAAQRATRMPVQSKRFLGVVPDFIAKGGVLPWGTKTIQAVLPAPGRLMRMATQRGMIRTLDQALNTKQPIRALLASDNPDMVLNGIELRRANNGRIRVSSQFKTQLEPLIEEVVLTSKRLGITGQEVQAGSEMPYWVASGPFGWQVNPNLPAAIKALDVKVGEAFHAKTRQFWELARTTFNDLAGEEVLVRFADDMYAARFLSDEGKWAVFNGTGGARTRIPFGGKQSPLKQRTYLTVPDFRQSLDTFIQEQTAASAAGVRRTIDDVSEKELAQFDAMFRASGRTDEFMGVKLDSTRTGASVRHQMQEIGKNRIGADFIDMYEDDFLKVGARYLRAMADEAGRMHMVTQLADAGILFREPTIFMGDRLNRLTAALSDSRNYLSSATKKAAVIAEAADEGVGAAGQQSAALLAEVKQLHDEMSSLVTRAHGARSEILDAGARYADEFQPLTDQAGQAASRLAEIEGLDNALDALRRQVEVGATGTGDWITTSLRQEIEAVRSMIRSLNVHSQQAAGLDRSVQELKDILGVLAGHDPSAMASRQIKDWSAKLNRIKAIQNDLGDWYAIAHGEAGTIDDRIADLERVIANRAAGRGTALDPDAVTAITARLDDAERAVTDVSAEIRRLESELAAVGKPATGTVSASKALRQELKAAQEARNLAHDTWRQNQQAYGRNASETLEAQRVVDDLNRQIDVLQAQQVKTPKPKTGGGMTRKAREAKQAELVAMKSHLVDAEAARAVVVGEQQAMTGSVGAARAEVAAAEALEGTKGVFAEAKLGPVGAEGKRPYSFKGDPYGDAPKIVRTSGAPKGEVFQPTGVPYRVTRAGKVVETAPPTATPKARIRPVPEGAEGKLRAIEFNERWADKERQAALDLLNVRRTVNAEVNTARAQALDIEAQIRRMRADIMDARTSDSLTVRMTAEESSIEAVRAFNDARALHGFQDMYATRSASTWGGGSARPWGMSGYDMVASNREDVELMNAVFQSLYRINDESALKSFFGQYDQFMGWWKAGAVSSPGGFATRNFLGGAWINTQIAGVEMAQHSKVWGMYKLALKEGDGDILLGARRLREAGKSRRLRGTFGQTRFRQADALDWDYFDQIVQSGVARSGQVAGEIETSLESLRRMIQISGRPQGRLAPWSAEWIPFYKLRNLNERVEFMLRGAVGMDVMQKGGTLDDAVESILKYHFDYTPEALTTTERHIRRVIPFWRWQKNVIPVLIESMGRRPTAWSRLLQIKKELELNSDSEGVVADYYAENWGMRLPFRAQGAQVYTLPDMPWRSLVQLVKEPTSPMRTIGEMMSPPLKLPIEIWSDKQIFADIPFTGRLQQTPLSYSAVPLLMPILGTLRKAKKNSKGEWMMRDHDIYILDQMMPMLGRARRMLKPNEERYQRRIITTWLSQVFGISVRVNTKQEKANQIRRNNEAFDEMWRDKLDVELRSV